MSEHAEQVALFDWAERTSGQPRYAALECLYAIPNGARLEKRRTRSPRYVSQAEILKREGLRPGMPDTCLPVARGGYSSLYIELKVDRHDATPDQIACQIRLNRHGAFAITVWEWLPAANLLIAYLEQSPDFAAFLDDSFTTGPRGGRSYRWRRYQALPPA